MHIKSEDTCEILFEVLQPGEYISGCIIHNSADNLVTIDAEFINIKNKVKMLQHQDLRLSISEKTVSLYQKFIIKNRKLFIPVITSVVFVLISIQIFPIISQYLHIVDPYLTITLLLLFPLLLYLFHSYEHAEIALKNKFEITFLEYNSDLSAILNLFDNLAEEDIIDVASVAEQDQI